MPHPFMSLPTLPPIPLGEDYMLFNRVSLETSKMCNRTCAFCPCHTGLRSKQELMSDETFSKIIDELVELGFDGVLQMFFLNEPLLDPNIRLRIQEARDKLPKKVTIYTSTNGDVLASLEKGQPGRGSRRVDSLFEAGLNCLNLNIYDETEENQADNMLNAIHNSSGRMQPAAHKYQRYRGWNYTVTDMRTKDLDQPATAGFNARSAADRAVTVAKNKHCSRPMRHIVFCYDGRVPLCCTLDTAVEDPRMWVGNVNERSIKDIWNDEAFWKIRYFLQDKRRQDHIYCENCDHHHAFPHIHRKVSAPEGLTKQWEEEAATRKKDIPLEQAPRSWERKHEGLDK